MNKKQMKTACKKLMKNLIRRVKFYEKRRKQLHVTIEEFADSPELQKQFENEFNNLESWK